MAGLAMSTPVSVLGLTGITELGKVFELERTAGPRPDLREAPEPWRAGGGSGAERKAPAGAGAAADTQE